MPTPAPLARGSILLLAALAGGRPAALPAAGPPAPAGRQDAAEPAAPTIVARLQEEAGALQPLVGSELARSFLQATAWLPEAPGRRLWRHRESRTWLPAAAVAALADEEREAWEAVDLEPSRFYLTKHGTPLAYTRAVDLLGQAGLQDLDGRRVLDFGHGSIGQLRLLALLGADVVGVDVDSFLTALYGEPGDQGTLSVAGERRGSVTLLEGHWPADEALRRRVGGGYALFLSKNVLKRGYVHPEREAPPSQLLHLGVDDETFLRAVHAALLPGGFFLVHNLCPAPAPADEPYIPWADGRFPFARELVEAVGLEVLAFDVVDDGPAREMGGRLGWGASMDLSSDLFAWYTLLRKPGTLPPAATGDAPASGH